MFRMLSAALSKHVGLDLAGRDGHNRRCEPRLPQSGRTVALAVGDQTVEFYLSDISRGGVGGRCNLNIQKGQKVAFTFGKEGSVQGRVRWQSGAIMGIQFLNPLPRRLLGQFLDAAVRKEQRVDAAEQIFLLGRNGMGHPAILRNVSVSGMLIETNLPLLIGQRFKVRSATGLLSDARVVWCREGKAGLEMCSLRLNS